MEKELYHHGVKGMKWGVRRNANKNRLPQKDRIKSNGQLVKQQTVRKTPSKKKNSDKEVIDRMVDALDQHMKAQKVSIVNTAAVTALKAAGFDYSSAFMQGAGNTYVRNLSASSGYDFWRY